MSSIDEVCPKCGWWIDPAHNVCGCNINDLPNVESWLGDPIYNDGGYNPAEVTTGDYFSELFGGEDFSHDGDPGPCPVCGDNGCFYHPAWAEDEGELCWSRWMAI